MKKSTIVFSILGVLLLTAGVGVGVYLVRQNQNIAEKASAATTIYVDPPTQTKSPGDTFSFNVNLNTGVNAITTFDVEMTFDPSAIHIDSLALGSGVNPTDFARLRSESNNDTGTISFSYYSATATLTGPAVQIMVVNATVKSGASAGNYNLAFDPNTAAATAGESQNAIATKTQGVLTVQGPAGSPSPSASASPAASPSPSGNASPSPSGSATPAPSHAPTPVPSSGTGGTGSVSVSSPASGSTVSDSTPTIKGTAPAGSTVTITIQSTPVTVTVKADANGNWQYTPTQVLSDGSHTVTIAASGTTKTATSSFTVLAGSATLPVTGIEWPTVTAGVFGIMVIIGSILLAI